MNWHDKTMQKQLNWTLWFPTGFVLSNTFCFNNHWVVSYKTWGFLQDFTCETYSNSVKSSVEKMVSQSTSMGHVSPEYQTTNNSGTMSNDHFCFCYQSSTENGPIHVLNPVVSRISIRKPQDERSAPRCTEEKNCAWAKSLKTAQFQFLNDKQVPNMCVFFWLIWNLTRGYRPNNRKKASLDEHPTAAGSQTRSVFIHFERSNWSKAS